jgi:hypothetical protein
MKLHTNQNVRMAASHKSTDSYPVMYVHKCETDRSVIPGPNPTTSIYNATGSRARFENRNLLFYFEKRSSLLHNAGVVAVNLKVAGLAPGYYI